MKGLFYLKAASAILRRGPEDMPVRLSCAAVLLERACYSMQRPRKTNNREQMLTAAIERAKEIEALKAE